MEAAQSDQSEDKELEARLRQAFDEVDVDKTGVISKDELKLVFEKSGFQVTDKALRVSVDGSLPRISI